MCISVYLCLCLSIYLSIYLFAFLLTCLPTYLLLGWRMSDWNHAGLNAGLLIPGWRTSKSSTVYDYILPQDVFIMLVSGNNMLNLLKKGGGKLWHGRILWIMEKYRTLRNTRRHLDICRHHSLVLHISPKLGGKPLIPEPLQPGIDISIWRFPKIWIPPNHPCSMGFSINKNHPPLMEPPICYHLGEL